MVNKAEYAEVLAEITLLKAKMSVLAGLIQHSGNRQLQALTSALLKMTADDLREDE
jgi:hypothetical protein